MGTPDAASRAAVWVRVVSIAIAGLHVVDKTQVPVIGVGQFRWRVVSVVGH